MQPDGVGVARLGPSSYRSGLLLGRETERARLDAMVGASKAPIVLVGLAGVGRGSLLRDFLERYPSWTCGAKAKQIGWASSMPRGEARVLCLGPLSQESSLALLRARLGSAHPLGNDVGERLVNWLGGFPSALSAAARLIQVRGLAWLEGALDRGSLWRLAAEDPGLEEWGDALSRSFEALSPLAQETVRVLASFEGPIPEAWLGDEVHGVSVLAGAGWLQVGSTQVGVPEPLRAWVRERGGGALARRGAAILFAVQDCAGPAMARELRAVMGSEVIEDAERAALQLAPCVINEGDVRHTLRHLLRCEARAPSSPRRVNEEIGRLHLSLGELGAALRRVQDWRQGGAQLAHLAANVFRRLDRHEESRAAYAHAIAECEARGDTQLLGLVLANAGGLFFELGDEDEAAETWARALRCHRGVANRQGEAIVLGDLGLLDVGRGDFDEAERRYAHALALHQSLGNERYAGIVLGDLGELELLRGDLVRALAHLRASKEIVRRVEDAWQEVFVRGLLTVGQAFVGELHEARGELGELRDQAPRGQRAFLALCDAALSLGEARVARRNGELRRAQRAVERCEHALDGAPNAPDEVRRLGLVLRAELERYARHSGWCVAADGSSFTTPEGVHTELGRQKILRRLLAALVKAHGSRAWLDQFDLMRAGWPEQRALNAAAKNRLHVALTKLRKLGLDALLERKGSRYRVDSRLNVEVV